MKINLTEKEIKLLEDASISFSNDVEYTEEEMLDILDLVYDKEVEYSNYPSSNKEMYDLAEEYAHLADKIQNKIPE